MKVGDAVRVVYPEGTLGFIPPLKDSGACSLRDLQIGEVGLVVGVRLDGIAEVLFPPGVVYEVVGNHLDVIG